MSRSKSRTDRESAIENTEKRMNAARRAEKLAHERVKQSGTAEARRAYIEATRKADRAEDAWHKATKPRDTGWTVLPTSHGPRFHREIGEDLQLDVEMQVTTWIASAVVCNVLCTVIKGAASAEAAALSIEERRGVKHLPLPEAGI